SSEPRILITEVSVTATKKNCDPKILSQYRNFNIKSKSVKQDSEMKKKSKSRKTTSKTIDEENLYKIHANGSADDSKFLDDIVQGAKFSKFVHFRTNVADEFCGGLICKFCKIKFCSNIRKPTCTIA
uniref:Uncharacterized protein n=1 Tax=Romanomermis culicivorax TaxID=13658 RepID=A0A915HPZ6_ROMCU